MKIKADVVLREIAGDYLLVPMGETVMKYNGLFSLSEVGARIWTLLPEADSEEYIVKKLTEEYDAGEDDIKSDVSEFLNKLREMDIIE